MAKKVVHVITDLATGGSEMMLYKLLSRMDRKEFEPVVISLIGKSILGPRIEELGIPVHALGMKHGRPTLSAVWRLIRLARRLKPDLIQGWLTHGNLAALLASAFAPRRVPVVWAIQYSLYSLEYEKPATAAAMKVGARLSGLPARIVFDSETSIAQHKAIGYRTDKAIVIPTGYDTGLFYPKPEARGSIRAELGVGEDTILIGLIGRYHPMKDHANFFRAAVLLLNEHPDVHFVLSGRGVDRENEAITKLVDDLEIGRRVHLLGYYPDVPQLTAALDIASSSSYSEGSPTVVGEAMSSGVPCVVTDVGGSAWIVGDTGRVVPPRDPEALCAAWSELIDIGATARRELGVRARQRIKDVFSIEAVVQQYERVHEEQ